MPTDAALHATLEQIAKEHLGIETLEARNSDRLDFHDLSVWQILAALKAAYEVGLAERATVKMLPPPARPPQPVITGPMPTMTATMGQARYGSPEPRLMIEWHSAVARHENNAMLNMVTAAIWATRPPGQKWIVSAPEILDESARGTSAVIRIETVTGTQADADAALKTLEAIIGVYEAGRRTEPKAT